MRDDEFYVGYAQKAPKHTASAVRNIAIIIALLVCLISSALGLLQKKFSSASFEYGIETTLEGYVYLMPTPHLIIPLGVAGGKELLQRVLLVGFGKAGAKDVIKSLEQETGMRLVGSSVRLTGTMIYADGRALMQITAEDNKEITAGAARNFEPIRTCIQDLSVEGEVVDPKCYFGVMKPGEGKVHRSCAIRCISGGIPPVFHATGSADNYLLVDENAVPLNQEILSLVGDHITLSGESLYWDEWKILKVNRMNIRELSRLKRRSANLLAFENGMTKCLHH